MASSMFFLILDAIGMICPDIMDGIRPLGEGSSGGQEKMFGARYLLMPRSMLTQSASSTLKS